MKLLALPLIFLFSVQSFAVLKPANTSVTVTGKVVVSDQELNYSVQDNGWYTNYDFSSQAIRSEKNYRLFYTSDIPSARNTSLELVAKDAADKCAELGAIDFSEAASALNKIGVAKSDVSTAIINSSSSLMTAKAFGYMYVCSVVITAQ